MQRSAPFARAQAFMSALSMAMAAGLSQSAALSDLGNYQSRGHGQGCISNKHSRRTVAQDKRAALKARNKAKNRTYR